MAFNTSANKIAKALNKNRASSRPLYPQNPNVRLGTVISTYNRVTTPTGPTGVIFDGEDTAVKLTPAVPVFANDRVVCTKVGNTWVITGNISYPALDIVALKSTNLSVTNSTTLVADPELLITVGPGTWLLDLKIAYTADVAADIKIGWNVPADAAGLYMVMGPSSGTSDANDNSTARFGGHQFPSTTIFGARTLASTANATAWGRLATNTGGQIGITFAQNTANATASVLQIYSNLRAERIF